MALCANNELEGYQPWYLPEFRLPWVNTHALLLNLEIYDHPEDIYNLKVCNIMHSHLLPSWTSKSLHNTTIYLHHLTLPVYRSLRTILIRFRKTYMNFLQSPYSNPINILSSKQHHDRSYKALHDYQQLKTTPIATMTPKFNTLTATITVLNPSSPVTPSSAI
jgi:hypothetical protein